MSDFPHAPEEISAEWLTAALRDAGVLGAGRVSDVVVGTPADSGLLSVAVPLALTYEGAEGDPPATLFAKFAPRNAARRMRGLFERETGFYRDLAPALGAAVPGCVGAWWDGDRRLLLLLEDMRPSEIGTWWSFTPRLASEVVSAIAEVHAGSWGLAGGPPAWLGEPSLENDVSFGHFVDAMDGFAGRYASDSARRLLEFAQAVVDHRDVLARQLARFPQTVVHGDLHSQNVFVPASGGGRVAVFDWQTAHRGPGAADIAYHVAISLDVAARRAHEDALIEHYVASLARRGVRGCSEAEVREAYRLGLALVARVGVIVFGGFPEEAVAGINARARAFGVDDGAERMIERCVVALDDADFLGALEAAS